jgi:hypothetical protein
LGEKAHGRKESADLAARRRAVACWGLRPAGNPAALRLLSCLSVLWQVAGAARKGEFCNARKFHKFRELGQ